MSYGCFDRKPYAAAMWIQDGWIPSGDSRMPRMVYSPFRMSKDCQYSKFDRYADPGCNGCKWKKESHEE